MSNRFDGSLESSRVRHAGTGPESASRLLIAAAKIRQSSSVTLGGIGLLLVLSTTLGGPLLVRMGPEAVNVSEALSPPSPRHLLGTDDFGRDVLSRVIYGGRISLTAGLAATLMATFIGSALGLVFGFFGGVLDGVGMRLIDVLMAFPNLLLALAVIAVLGVGIGNTVVAVGITFIPLIARMVRAAVLRLASEEYVLAARALGCSNGRILWYHLFRNAQPTIIVTGSLVFGWAVLSVSALSFIGLAVRPPTPEWGAMLSEARSYLQTAWWAAIGPGAFLVLLILSVNLLGDGLRQVLDPKLRY